MFLRFKNDIIRPGAAEGDGAREAASAVSRATEIYAYFQKIIDERRPELCDYSPISGFVDVEVFDGATPDRQRHILDIWYSFPLARPRHGHGFAHVRGRALSPREPPRATRRHHG